MYRQFFNCLSKGTSNGYVGLARGRGRGRGRGQVKKTLNIMKAMSMSELDKLSLDKDFEVPLNNNNNNNNFLFGEDKHYDDDDPPLQCGARKFVKSSLFRKSINSITTDGKRREDGLNRIGSRSVSSLVVTEERRQEVLMNIKRIGQFHDAKLDVAQGDDNEKIKIEQISPIKIEGDDTEPNIIEDTLSQRNAKKSKQKKEREWDKGKIYDNEAGVWLTERTDRRSSRNKSNKSLLREWDRGKKYDAVSGQWTGSGGVGVEMVRIYRKSKHPTYFLHDVIDEECLS